MNGYRSSSRVESQGREGGNNTTSQSGRAVPYLSISSCICIHACMIWPAQWFGLGNGSKTMVGLRCRILEALPGFVLVGVSGTWIGMRMVFGTGDARGWIGKEKRNGGSGHGGLVWCLFLSWGWSGMGVEWEWEVGKGAGLASGSLAVERSGMVEWWVADDGIEGTWSLIHQQELLQKLRNLMYD